MITLKNITKTYGGAAQVQALKGINLTIDDGEIFGIIGKSGAGKSTLVRCINMLEKPTSGQVIIDDKDLTKMNESQLRAERKNIGMIFQHFNLLSSRTVAENIAFPLELVGASKDVIEKKVASLLDLVGLSDRAGNYPSQLSGGQKQRVGIARAIANHPEVLLCDEPTSALDLETSAAILELLQEINARLGITIVLISHEMAVIKKICTRVAVMDQGEVIEQGDVYDIFSQPQQPFTRQLVEHTFNLELPPHLTEDLRGTLLKILFLGERAEEPVLSEATLRFGISVNILHGKIEYINHRPIGLLIALLRDREAGPSRIAEAVDFVRDSTAQVEILHA